MLREALHAPGDAQDTVGTLLVGAILILATVVVVPVWLTLVYALPPAVLLAPAALAPAFVLRGYYVRVVAAGIVGAPGIPSFVRWGRLYRDGVKASLLSVGYLLPLIVLLGLGGLATGLVGVGRVELGEYGAAILVISLLFLSLLAVAYLVVYAYLRPAGLAVFASTGRLRDAFTPRRIGRVALDGEFATGWLLAIVVLLAGLTFAAPLSLLLVGFVVGFFVQVVVHRLVGQGAADALGATTNLAGDAVARGDCPDVQRPAAASSATATPRTATDLEPNPEADPAVQTGRSVPLTATEAAQSDDPATDAAQSHENGTADDSDTADDDTTDDVDSGEFEWGDSVDR